MNSRLCLFLTMCMLATVLIGFFQCSMVYAHGLNSTYTDKDVMVQQWKDLCDAHPDLASYEIVGKSVKGKDIYLFKIGDSNGRRVMMDCQAHGDEDAASEGLLVFAKWLLESNDSEARDIISQNCNMIIPVLNVDSYDRLNERSEYVLENGTVIKVSWGVDLNRNAVWGWGRSGSSDPYDGYSYHGLSAGSEPETQAWRYACEKYRPIVYINFHCGAYGSISYHSNTTLEENILQLMINFSKVLNVSTYPATLSRGGGGFIYADADESFGASGWLIELLAWSEMPATKEQLIDLYYPKMLAVFLAVNYGVMMEEAPEPMPEPTPTPTPNPTPIPTPKPATVPDQTATPTPEPTEVTPEPAPNPTPTLEPKPIETEKETIGLSSGSFLIIGVLVGVTSGVLCFEGRYWVKNRKRLVGKIGGVANLPRRLRKVFSES